MTQVLGAPPKEHYWAHGVGDENIWIVRGPGSDWPDEAEYTAFSLEDLLLWMIVKEIERVQLRRHSNGVVTVFWLTRAKPKKEANAA